MVSLEFADFELHNPLDYDSVMRIGYSQMTGDVNSNAGFAQNLTSHR